MHSVYQLACWPRQLSSFGMLGLLLHDPFKGMYEGLKLCPRYRV
jgi:hypothetical protein